MPAGLSDNLIAPHEGQLLAVAPTSVPQYVHLQALDIASPGTASPSPAARGRAINAKIPII